MKTKGFTLLEVLIGIVLVGIAIAALVAGTRTFTQVAGAGVELCTSEFLIEQIRELTTLLPVVDPNTGTATFGPEEAAPADYDDLDDLDEAVFCPPISADRTVLNDLAAYSQQITVENLHPSDFAQVVADHGSSFVRVTVEVALNSKPISSASWIRANYE